MVLIVYQLRYILIFSSVTCSHVSCFQLTLCSLQVVARMRDMVSNDMQNPVSNSFLLDDDLRLVVPGASVHELTYCSVLIFCMIHALKTYI
jgi:hypothetical protein